MLKSIVQNIIVACIIIACILFITGKFHIVPDSTMQKYIALENAKTETSIDTLYIRDTSYIKVPGKPQLVTKFDTCWLPSKFDSTYLIEQAKYYASLYLSTYVYNDTLKVDDKLLAYIIDTVSQNKIQGRLIDIALYKSDTVYVHDNNHVIDLTKPEKLNNIAGSIMYGNDIRAYTISYARTFTKHANKLQFDLGIVISNIEVNTKQTMCVGPLLQIRF